ncbi:MAG: glycosyltransferase family 4 protein [Chloroflexi bacterium]|nr:glycosyltransferase family 4 protein [Chloroflexota bacterium]
MTGGSPGEPAGRLVYVGGFDFPTPQARGIQTLHTAHALARAGWGVRLLAQKPERPAGTVADALAGYGLTPHPRLRIVSVPVARIDRLSWIEIHKRLAVTNWSYALACVADVLRLKQRPTAIVTRDPRLAWIFLRTKPLHGRPVVYEVHEIFSTAPRENRSLDPAELKGVSERTRALEASVFAEADLLLPLTQACADIVEYSYRLPTARIAVVPDATTPPSGPLPPRPSDTREIVYAGQLYRWKGVDTLLDAMTELPGARLTVYGGRGPGDPDLHVAQAKAAQVGVADRVTFAGFVPHAEVRRRIAGAGAAILPLPDNLMARYFTSPLKLFDYMAAGTPIVASDLQSVGEVLTDGDNALLAPPEDPPALAAAVRRLLANPGLADRLRRTAYEQVQAFTWDARAARIIQALGRLTDDPLVAPPHGEAI